METSQLLDEMELRTYTRILSLHEKCIGGTNKYQLHTLAVNVCLYRYVWPYKIIPKYIVELVKAVQL